MNEHKSVSLRPVSQEDDRILYEWSNSDLVRSVSLSTSKFSWESHQKWFRKCLKDQKCTIFVGLNVREEPIGQIRFNQTDELNAEVHVNINPDLIGQGLGTALIQIGTEKYFSITNTLYITALVLESNMASINAFNKANYIYQSDVWINKIKTLKLVRRRS